MDVNPYHISPYYKPLSLFLWVIGLIFAFNPMGIFPKEAFSLGFIFISFAAIAAIAYIPDFGVFKTSRKVWMCVVVLIAAGLIFIGMAEPSARLGRVFFYSLAPLSCVVGLAWRSKSAVGGVTSGLWRYVIALPIVALLYFYAVFQDAIMRTL